MKEKVKSFLKNPWVIGIGMPVGASLIASALKSILSNINFSSALLFILSFIGKVVADVVTYRIPLWIVALVLVVGRFLYKLLLFAGKTTQQSWQQYKMDYIKNWLFAWDYSDNRIISLHPICTRCKCVLSKSNPTPFVSGSEDFLYCPNCESRYDLIFQQTLSDVKKIIVNRLQTGEYKNSRYFAEPTS